MSRVNLQEWVDEFSSDQQTMLAILTWHHGAQHQPPSLELNEEGFQELVQFMSLPPPISDSGKSACEDA
jgi:hypothetical protein